jgi:hypothetical protein
MQEADMDTTEDFQTSEMPPKLDKESETERLQVVAPASWVRRVEEWRRAQPRIPSRSEAIRQLVDAGLEATKKSGRHGR